MTQADAGGGQIEFARLCRWEQAVFVLGVLSLGVRARMSWHATRGRMSTPFLEE